VAALAQLDADSTAAAILLSLGAVFAALPGFVIGAGAEHNRVGTV
jgi:hypothetical protein